MDVHASTLISLPVDPFDLLAKPIKRWRRRRVRDWSMLVDFACVWIVVFAQVQHRSRSPRRALNPAAQVQAILNAIVVRTRLQVLFDCDQRNDERESSKDEGNKRTSKRSPHEIWDSVDY
jgi:hypothetical protein